MATNTIAENRPGTEQYAVKQFADLIRPRIEELGYKITTQINLPYVNFCDRIDENNKAIDHGKGKKAYAVDALIYREVEDNEKIPLVVIEGKTRSYSSHDVITYSDKAKHHKTVFPHLQYGFVVLDATSKNLTLRYHLHSEFDFGEIFPKAESATDHDRRIANFIEELKRQIETAEQKHKIFFASSLELG